MLVPNYFYAPNTIERKSTGLLGETRLGELFFGRETIGRQARTVRRQQIGWFGDIFQTVGRNV